MEHEAHHLTMRTTRHLKTIKSTHFRTLFYYLGIYSAIVGASFAQARTTVSDAYLATYVKTAVSACVDCLAQTMK